MINNKSGFTFLELIVTVAIIAILATFVGLNVLDKPGEARIANVTAQIQVFRSALKIYRMDNGVYPTQEQGLSALCILPVSAPVPAKYPEEGYLDTRNLPLDPWGSDYVYLVPGPDREPFVIISYGSDGQPGGEDEAADTSSASM